MCGIAGAIAGPGREPDRAALAAMASALRHRGPDGEGIEVIGQVGLVHTRLAIVDPTSAGRQPMRDGAWWLTYNGEAFNHRELRNELPGPWASSCDTETVLRLLASGGGPEQINGLFAYAALDTERGRVLLARDRFGVKPLYLARHDGALWFASEMRALLAAGVPARPRVDVLQQAIGMGWANGRLTPLDGIERVLPGTVVEIDVATLAATGREFYDPADVVDPDRPAPSDPVAALRDALATSVRRRLMADVPVATMCSGGIDSSLITTLAAREDPALQAFHVSLPGQPEFDERPYAEAVATAAGVPLHVVELTPRSFRENFARVVVHHEYPLLHPSSVPMFQLAARARDEGVKVLLSGEGADELFGGYEYLHVVERRAFARRGATRHGVTVPAPDPPSPDAAAYEAAVLERCEAAYAHHRGPRRRLEAAILTELRTYLPHLLHRQDRTTMQASVETRVPFLDPDLVALAVNLPLEARLRKRVPLALARELLPREVIDRPKAGFGFDAAAMIVSAAHPEFLADGRLRELLGAPSEPWRAGIAAATGHLPLAMWSAEVWCRAMLDGDSPDAIARALWADVDAPLARA